MTTEDEQAALYARDLPRPALKKEVERCPDCGREVRRGFWLRWCSNTLCRWHAPRTREDRATSVAQPR